ncbi:hypothetical protein FRC03_006056 [Tulasnella sp. 419]|nr:hypothetical protein FRC03_006056 [Tulasnella sp. 419]
MSRQNPREGYPTMPRVLHIQSPIIRTTFIRCPPTSSDLELGIKLPWIHLQVRNMGREWSFEVGVRTVSGGVGKIRCSTFQESNVVHTTSPPVLHLPLRLPSLQSSTTKTPWSTIAIDIRTLLPLFASTHLQHCVRNETFETHRTISSIWPSSKFESVAYMKVYATCRLRRIWFSKDVETDGPHNAWEFGLYGSQ